MPSALREAEALGNPSALACLAQLEEVGDSRHVCLQILEDFCLTLLIFVLRSQLCCACLCTAHSVFSTEINLPLRSLPSLSQQSPICSALL